MHSFGTYLAFKKDKSEVNMKNLISKWNEKKIEIKERSKSKKN